MFIAVPRFHHMAPSDSTCSELLEGSLLQLLPRLLVSVRAAFFRRSSTVYRRGWFAGDTTTRAFNFRVSLREP